jgi:hypothetical protein
VDVFLRELLGHMIQELSHSWISGRTQGWFGYVVKPYRLTVMPAHF